MNFDKFKEYVFSHCEDIEEFRDYFGTMHDYNGCIPSETIGFHFSFDESEEIAVALKIFETFKPTTIFCGKQSMLEFIEGHNYQGIIHSWFEDGGFAVVLKIPLKKQ